MSPAWTSPVPWSPRRWGWTIGGILAAQVFLIWLLADRVQRVPRRPSSGTVQWLELNPRTDSSWAITFDTGDPTLFALANRHSFSGAAWLNDQPAEHRLRDWTVTDHWLEPNLNRWGATFHQFVQTRTASPLLGAEKPEPRLVELFVTNELAPTQSSWRVEGELAQRPLVGSGPVPVWTHAELLTDSVVQVAAGPSGNILSAKLWASCGLPAADQSALAWAKSAQFQPLPGSDDTFLDAMGQLSFPASQASRSPPPGAVAPSGPSLSGAGAASDSIGLDSVPNPFPLTWGRLVFSWCITNSPATNESGAK